MLVAGYVIQGLALAATAAALLAHGPPALVIFCAAVAATAITITRPTQAVLMPALARRPEELTAANVVAGWNESMSVLIAPAIGGVLLGVSGPGAVFAVMAALMLAGAVLVAPVTGPPANPQAAGRPFAAAAEGFRVVAKEPAARLLVGMLGAEFAALGMLDVVYVVLALDVLDIGQSGAGYLNAAFGLGGALAIGVTISLVGRSRLMPAVLASLGVWTAAFVLLSVWPAVGIAFLALAVAGGARGLFDVAGRTLLQRTAPSDVLARVFGVLEGLEMAALALGALVAPLLVAVGGNRVAILGGRADPARAGARGRTAALRARCFGARPDRGDLPPAVDAHLLRPPSAPARRARPEARIRLGKPRRRRRDAGRGRRSLLRDRRGHCRGARKRGPDPDAVTGRGLRGDRSPLRGPAHRHGPRAHRGASSSHSRRSPSWRS